MRQQKYVLWNQEYFQIETKVKNSVEKAMKTKADH